MIRTVHVDLGERAYDVLIGPGLLDAAGARLRPFVRRDRVAVVSDETVWGLQGARLTAALERADLAVLPIVMPPGEQTKSFAGLETLCDAL
ncbi:MAG: 3-dehydroquinate synthase, partial [Phenylobacterium sp.]|nr:3-dehydroquinate synthase [Phenylobacterium sp.]